MQIDLDTLAERFCNAPLPESVCADPCATDLTYRFPRTGANLLTIKEARQVLAHVLEPVINTESEQQGFLADTKLARILQLGDRSVTEIPGLTEAVDAMRQAFEETRRNQEAQRSNTPPPRLQVSTAVLQGLTAGPLYKNRMLAYNALQLADHLIAEEAATRSGKEE